MNTVLRRWCGALVLLLLGLAGTPPARGTPAATTPTDFTLLDQQGGPTNAVALAGGVVYTHIGATFVVVDRANPARPTPIGWLSLPGTVNDIAVDSGYAYVIASQTQPDTTIDSALYVIDVRTPSAPATVAVSPLLAERTRAVWRIAITAPYAYLIKGGCGSAGCDTLSVVDISAPATPRHVGTVHGLDAAVTISLDGQRALLASPTHVRLFDLRTPTAPTPIGDQTDLAPISAAALAGAYLYTAGPTFTVLEGLNAPLGAIATDHPGALTLAADTAYVAGMEKGLLLLSVRDPAAPAVQGVLDTPGLARETVVADGYAYLADGPGGLRVIDVRTPLAPAEVGVLNPPRAAQPGAVEAAGGYVYVADAVQGLLVFDPAPGAPLAPVAVAAQARGTRLAVNGAYAYVADGANGVHIVDLRIPTAPVVVNTIGTLNASRDVATAGTALYVADGSSLRIFDLRTPAVPTQTGVFSGTVSGVTVSGDAAYLWTDGPYGGMQIVDVRNPAAPVARGTYTNSLDGNAYGIADIAVAGPHAYLSHSGCRYSHFSSVCTHRLTTLDVRSPATPVAIHGVAMSGTGQLALDNGRLYLAQAAAGLAAFDLTVPAAPALLARADTPGWASAVAAAGEQVYLSEDNTVAYGGSGLLLLEPRAVRGQVADAYGMPWPDIQIALNGRSVRSDASGAYQASLLPAGTYTITPTLAGYTFSPPSRTVQVPADTRSQDFVILPASVSVALVPERATTLVLTDTQGVVTHLDLPPGAVTAATTLTLRPVLPPPVAGTVRPGLAFALELDRGSQGQLPAFAVPVTVTVLYGEAVVGRVPAEETLRLGWQAGARTDDAAATCVPRSRYVRDVTANMLATALCKVGMVSLLSDPWRLHLPLVGR